MKKSLHLALMLISILAFINSSFASSNFKTDDIDSKIDMYTKDKGLYDNTNLKLLRKLIVEDLSNLNLIIKEEWIDKIINYGEKYQPFENPNSQHPSISKYLELDLIKYVLSRKDVKIKPIWVEKILRVPFRPHLQEATVKYIFSKSDTPLQGKWFKNYIKDSSLLEQSLGYSHFVNFITPAMNELGIIREKYNVKFLKMAMDLPIFDELYKENKHLNKTCLNSLERLIKS